MYLANKLFILLITSLITLVSQSEDIKNIDLYIVPEEQPYMYVSNKDFFGEENFDKATERWFKKNNILGGFPPDTYPYPLSDKKCNIDIPMLIVSPDYHVKLKEGICVVYCEESGSDHCYSEMYVDLKHFEAVRARKETNSFPYIVPEGQSYININDKDFFGEENFDKKSEQQLEKQNSSRDFVIPTTYPYPLSDKKCNIDIPMLITSPVLHVKFQEGVCKVYCEKSGSDHCYSEMYVDLKHFEVLSE